MACELLDESWMLEALVELAIPLPVFLHGAVALLAACSKAETAAGSKLQCLQICPMKRSAKLTVSPILNVDFAVMSAESQKSKDRLGCRKSFPGWTCTPRR